MKNEKALSNRLITALARSGLRQKDLAKILGVTDNTISYFCSGKRTPQIHQLPLIAKTLNTTTDYLLGLTDDPEPKPSAVDDLGLAPIVIEKIEKLKRTSTSDCNHLLKINRLLGHDDIWTLLLFIHDYRTAAEVEEASAAILEANKGDIEKTAQDLEHCALSYKDSDVDFYDFLNFKALSFRTNILIHLGLESTNILEFINLRIEQQLHDILRRIKSETSFDTKDSRQDG